MQNQKGQMQFTKDEFGKEILLEDGHRQIMMEWEKPYIKACIDAIKPRGDVLEIGFGLGYSAFYIQEHSPRRHTIVESDPTVIQKAKEWAKGKANIKIVEGMWQDKLTTLGEFDAIFFDDYSSFNQETAAEISDEQSSGQEKVEEAENLRSQLEKAFQSYKNIRFDDSQLEDFRSYLSGKIGITKEYVERFMNKLEAQGNITAAQKKKFIQSLGEIYQEETLYMKNTDFISSPFGATGDRFIEFILRALKDHMRPGARLSAFTVSPETKRDNPEFQKKILKRPDVKYSEKLIDITVPSNCSYFKGNKALVMVIEKK